jgi:hypothetical protein
LKQLNARSNAGAPLRIGASIDKRYSLRVAHFTFPKLGMRSLFGKIASFAADL